MHQQPKREEDLEVPVILDESYDSHQRAVFHYGADYEEGLQAGAVYSLSMSEQAKDYPDHLQECQSTPPFHSETYLYAQPTYAPQPHYPAHNILSIQEDEGLSAAIEGSYGSELAYHAHSEQAQLQDQHQQHPREHQHQLHDLGDIAADPPPIVQSYHPHQGSQGTEVLASLYSTTELAVSPALTLSLMFGTKLCHSSLAKLEPQDPYFRYVLSVDAPAFDTTGWVDPDVAVYLRMDDETGQNLSTVDVGNFTYTDTGLKQQLYTSPVAASRKRKSSQELEDTRGPSKRTSSQPLRTASREIAPAYSFGRRRGASYSTYLQPETSNLPDLGRSQYDRSVPGQAVYQEAVSGPAMTYQYPNTSPLVSQANSRGPSPSTAAGWNAAYGNMSSHASRSPLLSTTSAASTMSSVPSISPPAGSANPPLIRTSTMQHPAGSTGASAATMQTGQAFNPYAMYPHKAVLDIRGDLDSMADGWNAAEVQCRRRLVQFQRQQSGNTIRATFAPIAPEDRPPQSICISCIWWEERQDFFVTSVDTIFLLESLVAVRFTVEEKNRIRRNLEGFRPLTVSKAKADSEEFFKVIMGFPHPKPRNIEKDVKVFPWKILAPALKKIIGKYSASYSSTAGTLPTAIGGGPSYDTAGPTGFYYSESSPEPDRSPRATLTPQGSVSYPSGMAGTARGSGAAQRLASPSDGRLAVPQLPLPSSRWSLSPQQQYVHQSPGTHDATIGGSTPRSSWDLSAYIENDSSSGPTVATGQPVYYQQQQRHGGGQETYRSGRHGSDHPTSRI